MNAVLLLAAGAAIAGGVLAVAVGDRRLRAVGLLLALAAAPLLAPTTLPFLALASREVGAALAAYLIWLSSRAAADDPAGRSETGAEVDRRAGRRGSLPLVELSLPAVALAALACGAAAAAAFASALDAGALTPFGVSALPAGVSTEVAAVAAGAAVSLACLGAPTLLFGREPAAVATAGVLVVAGSAAVVSAIGGPQPDLMHVAIAGLEAAVAGAGAGAALALGRTELADS